MTDRILVITPNGTFEETVMKGPPTLEELQKLCGGYVERVPLFNKYEGEKCKVYCDEEGKLKMYKINPIATDRWYNNESPACSWRKDVLVGDIVILQGKAMKGW